MASNPTLLLSEITLKDSHPRSSPVRLSLAQIDKQLEVLNSPFRYRVTSTAELDRAVHSDVLNRLQTILSLLKKAEDMFGNSSVGKNVPFHQANNQLREFEERVHIAPESDDPVTGFTKDDTEKFSDEAWVFLSVSSLGKAIRQQTQGQFTVSFFASNGYAPRSVFEKVSNALSLLTKYSNENIRQAEREILTAINFVSEWSKVRDVHE